MYNTIDSLYVPDLAPALKHPTVFKKFDALQKGESFLLINDHDPIPLFYELKAERPDSFTWDKIEDGPELWKVEITKTTDAAAPKQAAPSTTNTPLQDNFVLNVTLLEPRLKHPTIFKYFDALQPGQSFQILNDHDPKPLYYQMIAERGAVFSWQYNEKGPEWWKVEIKKNEVGETIGEIAAKDLRKAEVFKKYGIDFCCGGKKTLKQACEEVHIDPAIVEAELQAPPSAAVTSQNDYTKWNADFLADYIYNQYHLPYYQEAPVINDLLEKVVARHGDHHPELYKVLSLYKTLQAELNTHFLKEEKVLFPFIKALAKAQQTGDHSALQSFPSITEPVQMMEADHEMAGDILRDIRAVTNNLTTPEGSCNSYQLLYKKLADFENELHTHVHLENNILFPKALTLEKELRK